MNLPNKITIFRIILIPFFLYFLLNAGTESESWFRLIAVIIFFTASLSDFADGYIARKYNLVSDFGKLMDPLADKMLVCSALVALTARNELSAWVVIIILCREFIVTGLRQIALEKGLGAIAASMWGKWKTFFQMTMIIFLMAGINFWESIIPYSGIIEQVLIYTAVTATIFSMLDYIWAYNKAAVKKKEQAI